MIYNLENKQRPTKVTGTGEWAEHNYNFISGCEHDCLYCYSKSMAIRFKRKTPENWKIEEIREEDINKSINKKSGRIFFPSSHDITPQNLTHSIEFLHKLLIHGNEVLIVTKPHLECIKAICKKFELFKDKILFRFTIGSTDSRVLKFWEPGAPDFNERFKSLRYAYMKGFNTSISCEPMLDDRIEDLIEKTPKYVTDSIWIGKANRLKSNLAMNGQLNKTTEHATKILLTLYNDSRINQLYKEYKTNTKIKWKDSIKKIVGIELSTKKGLDI